LEGKDRRGSGKPHQVGAQPGGARQLFDGLSAPPAMKWAIPPSKPREILIDLGLVAVPQRSRRAAPHPAAAPAARSATAGADKRQVE